MSKFVNYYRSNQVWHLTEIIIISYVSGLLIPVVKIL
jgi:hypothetical protein